MSPLPSVRKTGGIVLAGGHSRRMGRDKALLLFEGRPLVEHMANLLREALGPTSEPGSQPWLATSGWTHDGLRAIPDLSPSQGPMGGIHSCLVAARDEGCARVLFVPVDMPLLGTAPLRALVATETTGSEKTAVHFRGQELPFLCLANEHTLRLSSHHGSVRGFLERAGTIELDPSGLPASTFLNANTPSEWAGLPGKGTP
ncbi:MAG: molybdenum cofactor guanylyltransferase [Oligoflexia bacterium]|nr:molybdenum cofactor guanylyltransferase [Oligoflexia bacterium]